MKESGTEIDKQGPGKQEGQETEGLGNLTSIQVNKNAYNQPNISHPGLC